MTAIDDDDIRQLRDEAGTAGDLAQVRLCDAALDGDGHAWQECEEVIGYTRMRAAEDAENAGPAPHFHDATGTEDTPCWCPAPGTYAPQASEENSQ